MDHHGIESMTKWNEVPHPKKMEAAQKLENALQLGWLYEGWWLHMWVLKECRKARNRANRQSEQSTSSGGDSNRGFSVEDLCE
jgi:hypothetical protein